jgi:hypothetical protein
MLLHRYLIKFKILIDLILIPLVIFSSFVFLFFRKFGVINLPLSSRITKRIGIFPIIDHYYEPQFRFENYDENQFNPLLENIMTKVDTGDLNNILNNNYINEFIYYTKNSIIDSNNLSFNLLDSLVLYCFVRTSKPKFVLEIGGGISSLIINLANILNKKEGLSVSHVIIEPFENTYLDAIDTYELIRERAEILDHNLYSSMLQKDDFVFIDTSHIIRPYGDINWIYNLLLPSLRSGVNIHIHDIFLPFGYPKKWLENYNFFWNEQYLLESILVNSNRYEIKIPLNYLFQKKSVIDINLYFPLNTKPLIPGSIYLKVSS